MGAAGWLLNLGFGGGSGPKGDVTAPTVYTGDLDPIVPEGRNAVMIRRAFQRLNLWGHRLRSLFTGSITYDVQATSFTGGGVTSGSNPGHTHTGLSLSAIDHEVDLDQSSVTADQHHSEAHTVASHSDTTATGAELETLTDGSVADSLHKHSELMASDGSPKSIYTDEDGLVTIGKDTTVAADLVFTTEGGGLVFGSCCGYEFSWTQAAAEQDTWYKVTITSETGPLNRVTHDNAGKLTVTEPGKYLVNWSLSIGADAADTNLEIALSVSGTEVGGGIQYLYTFDADKLQAAGGTAILDLADDATVQVSVRTGDAGAPDITVATFNLSVLQVGGT